MNRRASPAATFFRALILIAAAVCAPAGHAAEPAQDQKALVAKLVDKMRAPYSTRAFDVMLADLQRNVSTQFIDGFGRGAKLSPEWRRGNPYWERAHARLMVAIKD